MIKADIYQQVTDRILHELEKGVVPWVKPWTQVPGDGMPYNAGTKRGYTGGNVVLLWMAKFGQPEWKIPAYLTYNQAKALGGNVKKGEKGTQIVFVKPLRVQDKANPDKSKMIQMMRGYTVFNVAQCENLPEKFTFVPEFKPINQDQRIDVAEEFMKGTGADIRIDFKVGKACYIPSIDAISLPDFGGFKSADDYYATAFHELGHWTGGEKRLNRDLKNRFGSHAYAAEELVAELASAFLCAEFEFDGELQSASYIANWIELLKEDKRAFFTAASKAQQAVNLLRGIVLADEAPASEPELAQAA